MYSFTLESSPLCTGLLEAVAGHCIVFLIRFVIYLVCPESHKSPGELIIISKRGQVQSCTHELVNMTAYRAVVP